MQSTPPTHPELLDWLAIEFVRREWSMKQIIKTIVTSSTYRQTSAAPGVIDQQRIHQTSWLARGPRFRLSGELIRDNVLSVSGLLEEQDRGAFGVSASAKGTVERDFGC